MIGVDTPRTNVTLEMTSDGSTTADDLVGVVREAVDGGHIGSYDIAYSIVEDTRL